MNRIEGKLFALGYELPDTAPAMALYSPVVIHSGLAYVSGQLPRDGDRVVVTGAVGRDVSIAEAEESAKLALLRGLAALKESLGSLDRIQRVLKLSVYIQSAPAFTEQSRVACQRRSNFRPAGRSKSRPFLMTMTEAQSPIAMGLCAS
jgi:enamine deaminase RidA (YjgF/YER057c/UK114 family)